MKTEPMCFSTARSEMRNRAAIAAFDRPSATSASVSSSRTVRSASGEAPRLREADALRHVLPPRRGGVLALLEAAPTADVVILAHTGLEDAARLGDLWRGSLVGGTIEVELWREPRAEIPADAAGREAWLQDCWRRVDQWIETRRGDQRRGASAP